MAANYTPGPMGDGNWTSALYVDERANPQQREALEQILSGQMGGPAERWRSLITNFMGIKYVPIEFRVEGRVHSVVVPEIMDFSVEPIVARGQSEAMRLDNTSHGVNRDLYLAKGSKGSYIDHGMHWGQHREERPLRVLRLELALAQVLVGSSLVPIWSHCTVTTVLSANTTC